MEGDLKSLRLEGDAQMLTKYRVNRIELLNRFTDDRTPKQALHTYKAQGQRCIGRPSKRWVECNRLTPKRMVEPEQN